MWMFWPKSCIFPPSGIDPATRSNGVKFSSVTGDGPSLSVILATLGVYQSPSVTPGSSTTGSAKIIHSTIPFRCKFHMTVLDASTKHIHESPFCDPIRFGLAQLPLDFFMRTNIGEAREHQEGASIVTDTGITKKVYDWRRSSSLLRG